MMNPYPCEQGTWPAAYQAAAWELPGEDPVKAAERRAAEAECQRARAMFLLDPCARRTAEAQLSCARARLRALLAQRA